MMERKQIIAKLRTLLADRLELDVPSALQESDRLYEDLQVDSIMSLQLVVYLEETFGVEVPEDEMDQSLLRTVGSLADYIESLLRVEAP